MKKILMVIGVLALVLVGVAVFFAGKRIGKRLVFVRLGRNQCAIKRFDSLSFGEWRLQRFGYVERNVL